MLLQILCLACLLCSTLMTIAVAVLVGRRYRYERRTVGEAAAARAATIALLDRLSGHGEVPGAARLPASTRLDAAQQLMQLLSGADRAALLRLADQDGLFDAPLRQLGSTRAARRIDAIRSIEHFPTDRCVTALLEALKSDPRMDVRLEAATALVRADRLPGARAVVDQLDMRRVTLTQIHQALLNALAQHHPEDLVALLDDGVADQLRARIVDALGWSGSYAMLDEIEHATLNASPEVRCAALRAARALGHPAAARWVIPMLDDTHFAVRTQAVRTCARLRLRRSSEQIAALRHDPSRWVRLRAGQAMQQLRHAA